MKPQALIEIFPTHVALLMVRRGGRLDARERVFTRLEWPQPWTTARTELVDALRSLITELGAAGSRAALLYDLPDTACAVNSCPVEVPADEAEAAALLALEQSVPAGENRVGRAFTIRIDNARHAEARRHVLALSEPDSNLAALASIAAEAGLVPGPCVARDAAGLLAAVHAAGSADDAGAAVWVGPTSSSAAVQSEGKLLMARNVPVGLASLAASLCRVGAHGPTQVAGIPAAWSTLWSQGIPRPEGEHDPRRVHLSSMQPVLQRLGVELKQSMRFALPSDSRERTRLTLCGPGLCIPGLADALAAASGAEARPCPAPREAARFPSASLFSGAALEAGLLPRSAQQTARVYRARRWLVAGVCFAGAFTLYQRADSLSALEQAASRELELQTRLETGRRDSEAAVAELARRGLLVHAQQHIHEALARGVQPACVLRLLSESVGEQITLTGVELSVVEDRVLLNLRGDVRPSADDPSPHLRDLLDALERSPIVSRAELGATHRTTDSQRSTYSFSLTAQLVPIAPVLRLAGAEEPR